MVNAASGAMTVLERNSCQPNHVLESLRSPGLTGTPTLGFIFPGAMGRELLRQNQFIFQQGCAQLNAKEKVLLVICEPLVDYLACKHLHDAVRALQLRRLVSHVLKI